MTYNDQLMLERIIKLEKEMKELREQHDRDIATLEQHSHIIEQLRGTLRMIVREYGLDGEKKKWRDKVSEWMYRKLK